MGGAVRDKVKEESGGELSGNSAARVGQVRPHAADKPTLVVAFSYSIAKLPTYQIAKCLKGAVVATSEALVAAGEIT
jgi:hypothetical protein